MSLVLILLNHLQLLPLLPISCATQIASNVLGILVGVAATLMTALYQTWAGSKQKELHASSFQLLNAYTPLATVFLGLLVPVRSVVELTNNAPASSLQDSLAATTSSSLAAQETNKVYKWHFTVARGLAELKSAELAFWLEAVSHCTAALAGLAW
eukprot:1155503-Pelagomonas_calceolata.AAC.4